MARRSSPPATAKERLPVRSRVAEYAGEDTHEKLVRAARDLFLEAGPAHFSLREVARRVNVSAAAVYRHFDGKDSLVAAACNQGFQVFSSYLVRALEAPTPLERLLATGEQYRFFGLENPLDYRFIFMSPSPQMDKLRRGQGSPSTQGRSTQASTFRFLVDRVAECLAAGVLASGQAEKTAVLIWAHVHGLVSLRLSGQLGSLGDDLAFAEFYRESVARLLRGLAA